MSALPRRSTQLMIGVICSIIARTIAILMIERTMSVVSKAMRYQPSVTTASSVSGAF